MSRLLPPELVRFLFVFLLAVGSLHSQVPTFVVSNTNDSGVGSLRQAIADANIAGGNPTVTFDAAAFATPQVITLATSLSVTTSMTVQGPGAGLVTISGNNSVRVWVVSGGVSFTLRDATVSNGSANGGAGLLVGSTCHLTLFQCVISNNVSGATGGGILHQGGGGTITIDRSSFIANATSSSTGGAGIESAAVTNRISNTTFSGQLADTSGAAYRNSGAGVASFFTNCTFSGNTAATAGGGAIRIQTGIGNILVLNHCTITNNRVVTGTGGGINVASGVPLLLNNCLVADNYIGGFPSTTRSDVSGPILGASSNNLIGSDSDITGIANGTNGNILGTAGVPVDPLVGVLSDNGGPTQTHALLQGSPAINVGATPSETQSVFLSNNSGGTFTLTFNGQTTSSLSGTSTAAVVQAALEALPAVGLGNVVVQQIGTRYVVTFTGILAAANQPELISNTVGGLTVTVSTFAEGGLPAFDQRGSGFLRAVGVVDIGALEVQREFHILANTVTADEGTGGTTTAFNFTVSRTGSTAGVTTVDYTVIGSGLNPANAADFGGTFPSGTVTIADGQISAPVTVINVSHDSLVENDETFDVVLSNPAALYTIATGTATSTITNDDTATVSIAKINDGAELAVPQDGLFRVTQSAVSSSDTVLSYSVAGTATPGTDYTALAGSVTLLAGQLTADIAVEVLNDANASEVLETVIVTLTAVTAGSPGVALGSPTSATVDIAAEVSSGPVTVPVSSSLGDTVTGNGAPGADGTTNIGNFDILRRGAFLAENSDLVFPGSLAVGSGSPAVTLDNSQGLWKGTGSGLRLIARTGTPVPDISGAVFDYLPIVPAITDAGEITILASLRIGIGAVTVNDDTGIWSEVGGGGLSLVLREGDAVPGLAGVQVGRLASGAYATATTGATTGETAFSVIFKGASTDTAILRASVNGATVAVQVVARENSLAPGTALQFGNIAGSYSDPARMDAAGNLVFAALTKPGNKEGLWYQPVGGSLTKVLMADDTAPGTGGATFSRIQRPSIGSNGRIAFRAMLNANGDNSTSQRNDGIWFGDAANPASFTCILRRGDTNATVTGLTATQKVGNVWGGWLGNGNRGAWKGWVDMDGNGTSAPPTDVHGIYATTSGSMELIVKVGDAAPGVAGATFTGFDLPLVGGQEQTAFLGNIAGPGVTTTNNQGVWREAANGGGLALVLRSGDVITTTQGAKTVQAIDFPGSGQTDRRWEQPVMDSNGRILMNVIFTDGSSSQIVSP
ncbi:beta strand repeat-containing protein [Prosthecobacter dejongeii]|uniref:Calx-beta domain-containing protein n=1 Tax=Prosthecobacter dejongeii TaxID=48465 RepID=A0A7W7YLE3_9BACT|nr:choice-of-anchor tandem repeat NxxGxxAF-containing protein [Prosthecobacter dejongeii]MBB5038371.1 hypothetical protein [Prosthecobacter dejongeii]